MPQLQQAARLTAQASTLDAAASGVATMARICGECHVANGGPKPPAVDPDQPRAAKRDTLAKRMIRHMVAADELWEGLTMPSEAAWKAGADALRHAPTTAHQALPRGFVTRLLEVRELGEDADEAQTPEQRSNVLGQLLATCAECHALRVEHDF
jgi:cytochrome c553